MNNDLNDISSGNKDMSVIYSKDNNIKIEVNNSNINDNNEQQNNYINLSSESFVNPNKSPPLENIYNFYTIKESINNIVYHKTEKWFAYISGKVIVVENFAQEFKRKQIILKDSEYYLNSLKLSNTNSILFSSSNLPQSQGTEFLFYSHSSNGYYFSLLSKLKFSLISICAEIFHGVLIVVSPSLLSIVDYMNKEVLASAGEDQETLLIKCNPYINNIEFVTLSKESLIFWRINSSDFSLQFQKGKICVTDKNYIDVFNNVFVSCEYMPAINETIYLIICSSNGNIYIMDTKTNSLIYEYKNLLDNIYDITINKKYICFFFGNNVQYYTINYNNDINNIINIEDKVNIPLDSPIISHDLDISSSSDLVILTKKGILSYINLDLKCSIRIYNFLTEEKKIKKAKICKKTIEDINIKNIVENYYIVTSHSDDSIRIWSIPEYKLLYTFFTPYDSILSFDVYSNSSYMLIVASYSSCFIRLFKGEKLLGKISGAELRAKGNIHILHLIHFNFIYMVDEGNTVILVEIEKEEPLSVLNYKILDVGFNIVDIGFSIIEPLSKFYINIDNINLSVFSEKLAKKKKYDFYTKDKLPLRDVFSNNKGNNDIYEISFSPIEEEKYILYILSVYSKKLIIRNFENHSNIRVIQFMSSISSFCISPSFSFIILMYKKKTQKVNLLDLYVKLNEGILIENLYNGECENEEEGLYKGDVSDNSRVAICYKANIIKIFKC